jgi:hypothetical protein
MPFRPPPRPSSVLASALAAAGLMLTVASCSHITPLGPDAAATLPPPRHLGSPIIVQVMRLQPPAATGGCPAGWVAESVPGGPVLRVSARHGRVHRVGPGSTPTPPAPPPPPGSMPCYRPAGTPVTITSAAVSPVSTYQPPPGQAKGPNLYGFTVAVPAADVAAVTAVIRQAYNSGGAVGISVAGKLWQAPHVREPFPGQRLQIAFLSKNQARQLYRILIPSG